MNILSLLNMNIIVTIIIIEHECMAMYPLIIELIIATLLELMVCFSEAQSTGSVQKIQLGLT